MLWLCLCKLDLDDVLATTSQLAWVVAVAAVCDIARDNAGLLAALLMGLAVANLRAFDVPARRPFFETLAQLIIGVLFVSISATVTPQSLHHLVLPALGLVAVLVVAARPLVAFLATIGSGLTGGERAFTGWMAPRRGIVAAATASTFGATLAASHVGGASKILPVTFLVIVATVALYGLTAVPVARRLGVTRPARSRPLLIGGDPWVIDLASAFRAAGLEVLLWSPSESQRTQITQAALDLAPGELLTSAVTQGADIEGITAQLLLTGEDDFNALAAITVAGYSDRPVYRLAPSPDALGPDIPGDTLFAPALTRPAVTARYANGARITTQPADRAIPPATDLLFMINPQGTLIPATASRSPDPQPGGTLVLLQTRRKRNAAVTCGG